MSKKCDNKSVGMIIQKGDDFLLIERKKPPFGFAPPAGHVDDFPSPEDAAHGEVNEEVGLHVEKLDSLAEGRKDNPCRREGGDYHYWWIYRVTASGELVPSKDETKQVGWYSLKEIQQLAERTKSYNLGKISEKEWRRTPGLEPVWHDWFIELGIIDQ